MNKNADSQHATKINIQALVPELLDVARMAGQVIMAIYDAADLRSARPTDLQVSYKADASPLTKADLAAHQVIHAGLTNLAPGVPVVSEEDAASMAYRQPSGEFWLIDPLDGTKEFVARNGEFTVNIALIRDRVAVFGIVFAPVLGALYWGGQGIGAFRESGGDITSVRAVARVPGKGICRVVASKSHLDPDTLTFMDRLGPHECIQVGSSLKFCRVAEGAADVYPRMAPTCEWDTAAAQAIVEAAGGLVVDMQGKPLRYGKPNPLNPSFVVASSPLAILSHT